MSTQESDEKKPVNGPVNEEAGDAKAGPALSPEQLTQLLDKAAKADELRDQLLRTVADMDNLRKRAAREKQDAIRYANESVLEKLVPVLDNFEAAVLATASAEGGSVDALKQGVTMILSQFKNVMAEAGLEEINAQDKPFDPNLHEAVSQQVSKDVPEGQVIQQLRKGYKLKDRLLRPATVVVSKKA
ncbi:MAG: molecular chaperone GrpE [Verrucomicrobia bacterium]|jgi:molecular chaperone GrpE|nr:molecular chaperone GrpE [Verrucomicrobiota bacterium]